MVKDSSNSLKSYFSLDEKLRNLSSYESIDVPEYRGFVVDKEHTSVFLVNKGEGLFATSWRENPDSRDVTGLVSAKQGDFVLYLPGEPMLVKCGEDSEISLFILK